MWRFHTGGTKLERFLPKNQHTQGMLNFGAHFLLSTFFEKKKSIFKSLSKLCPFLTTPHKSNSQNSIIFFEYVDSLAKIPISNFVPTA